MFNTKLGSIGILNGKWVVHTVNSKVEILAQIATCLKFVRDPAHQCIFVLSMCALLSVISLQSCVQCLPNNLACLFTAVSYTHKNVGLLDFQTNKKTLFTVHLQHSRLWPSANVNSVSNALEHAMPRQCIIALYTLMLWSLWPLHVKSLHVSVQCLPNNLSQSAYSRKLQV